MLQGLFYLSTWYRGLVVPAQSFFYQFLYVPWERSTKGKKTTKKNNKTIKTIYNNIYLFYFIFFFLNLVLRSQADKKEKLLLLFYYFDREPSKQILPLFSLQRQAQVGLGRKRTRIIIVSSRLARVKFFGFILATVVASK